MGHGGILAGARDMTGVYMEYGMLYTTIYMFLMTICYDLRGGSNIGGPEGLWSYAAVLMIGERNIIPQRNYSRKSSSALPLSSALDLSPSILFHTPCPAPSPTIILTSKT